VSKPYLSEQIGDPLLGDSSSFLQVWWVPPPPEGQAYRVTECIWQANYRRRDIKAIELVERDGTSAPIPPASPHIS
jgi:hypothetical protein